MNPNGTQVVCLLLLGGMILSLGALAIIFYGQREDAWRKANDLAKNHWEVRYLLRALVAAAIEGAVGGSFEVRIENLEEHAVWDQIHVFLRPDEREMLSVRFGWSNERLQNICVTFNGAEWKSPTQSPAVALDALRHGVSLLTGKRA